jgi:hypothetical protein
MSHRLFQFETDWRRTLCVLTTISAIVANSAIHAQEDPFGAAPKGAAAGAKGEADPFAGGAAPAAQKNGQAAAATAQVDPLPIELQRLRDSRPKQPIDLLRSAQAALQFGRPDESKRYLEELLASQPADEQLAPLVAKHGDLLFQLRRREGVQPAGAQTADLIFGAARRLSQNAERIEALVARLSDPDVGARQAALGELSLAGRHAVNPLLRGLADLSRAAEHAQMRGALVRLAGDTELPLIGALQTPQELLKLQVVAVLGRMRAPRAVVPLLRPAVDPNGSAELRGLASAVVQQVSGGPLDLPAAVRQLTQEYRRLMAGELPYRVDADDNVELWSWDEESQGVVATRLPKGDAAALLAARAASELLALQPGDAAIQRKFLLASLQHSQTLSGLDRPLSAEAGAEVDASSAMARAAGPEVMNQVLADALAQGKVAAAIAAAELLGHSGAGQVLRTDAGGVSPLGEAMRHPDRRVRLAAALAAVKLAPGASFAGASRVSETLGWLIGTSGSSSVLVGHPRGEDAQTLVALMNELGLQGEAAYVGRVVAERAFANPDFDFVLITDAIDGPPVMELVQWLRWDYRTAQRPVGVMARGENLQGLRDALQDDPYTTVFPRVYSVEVAAQEIAKLRQVAGRNFVPPEERIAQAQAALAALTTLAQEPGNLAGYELLRLEPVLIDALNNRSLSAGAAQLLGLLGSPRAQTALVDFASQSSRPLADQQGAAAGFAAAVKTRGVLLTQAQIARQYARYNGSEKLAEKSRGILSSLLDVIEGGRGK